jgi:hypothetical protein
MILTKSMPVRIFSAFSVPSKPLKPFKESVHLGQVFVEWQWWRKGHLAKWPLAKHSVLLCWLATKIFGKIFILLKFEFSIFVSIVFQSHGRR